MPVAAAPHFSRSTRRVFALIHDSCLHFQRQLRTAGFECSWAALQHAKKRKRTRKRSRRLRAKTLTRLTTLKPRRGGCLSVASFPVKRPKSCARVSRQQV